MSSVASSVLHFPSSWDAEIAREGQGEVERMQAKIAGDPAGWKWCQGWVKL